MNVTVTPTDERTIAICQEHGLTFEVIIAEKERLLVKADDGWQGVFTKEDAEWENLL